MPTQLPPAAAGAVTYLPRLQQPSDRLGVSFGGMTRCGNVVLAGPHNVGKSTLLNALVGEHLAIVSPKPQSTRLPVVGLLTRADAQFIFTDSPGLLEPEYRLHEAMRAAALRAIADAEVIAYLHPLSEYPAPALQGVARLDRPPRAPVVTVYTKADLVPRSDRPTGSWLRRGGAKASTPYSTRCAHACPTAPSTTAPTTWPRSPPASSPPSSSARRRSNCCTKSCPTAWRWRLTSSGRARRRCIFGPWSTSSATARRAS